MLSSGRAAVWTERLRRYERLELTVAEFCQREGVSVPSFYQWRRRLCETPASPPARRARRGQRPEESVAFQQVMLTAAGVVSIEWPGGVRMELPADQTPLVRAVVAELAQAAVGRAAGDR